MNKTKILKKFSCFLVLMTILLSFTSNVLNAKEETNEAIIRLTKEAAILKASERSSLVRGLKSNLRNISYSYNKMTEDLRMLNSLYDLMPRYKALFVKNEKTLMRVDYYRYLVLKTKAPIDQARLVVINQALSTLEALADPTVEEVNEIVDLTAEKGLIVTRASQLATLEPTITLADLQNTQLLSLNEFAEFNAITEMFSLLGIHLPLTSSQEYDIFIYPLQIVPMTFATNIETTRIALDTEKERLKINTSHTYNSLLILHSASKQQLSQVQLLEKDKQSMARKYELGLAAAYDAKQAQYDYEIALLEMKKMDRDIDTQEMAFKKMLGLELNKELELVDDYKTVTAFNPIETYIESALKNRNEIKTAQISVKEKKNERDYANIYLSSASDPYKIIEAKYQESELTLQQRQQSIEMEIRNAFADVQNKQAVMKLRQKEFQGKNTIYLSAQRYLALGYISEHTVNGYESGLHLSEQAYLSAQKSYYEAVSAIKAASGIGPAYNINGGLYN